MDNFKDFDENDTVDYFQVFDALKRKKFLILIIAAGTFLLGALYVSTRKPTWEGQFQIVIAERGKSLKSNLKIPGLGSSVKLGGKSQLKTEVEILKSPSVLLPIFKEYKIQKINKGEKDIDDLTYSDWLDDNFNIKLIRGSEVLNISYIDTDRDIIASVLKKVSKAYQVYSNKNRNREIELGLNYLGEQVKLFKKRSLSSFKEVQSYAFKHSLYLPSSGGEVTNPFTEDNINIQSSIQTDSDRVKVSKKLKYYERILKEIDKLKNTPEGLNYLRVVVENIKDERSLNLLAKLLKIDSEISLAKTKYKPDDLKLIRLNKDKKELSDFFYDTVLSFVKADLLRSRILLESIQIPEEVLLRYNELVRKSERDRILLSSLDKEYQQTALDKAKSVDPWELITEPTLLDKPVGPRKLRIMALSLLFGFTSGLATALYLYKNSKYVYSSNFITFNYGWKILENLSNVDEKEFKAYCEVLSNASLFSEGKRSVAFLKVGELDQNKYDTFVSIIKEKLEKIKYEFTSDIIIASKQDLIVLVGSLSKIYKSDLNKINKKLNIIGKQIDAFILI